MSLSRSLSLALLMIDTSLGSVCAQRRFDQRLPPPRDLQFYEPRNKLEELESQVETVLVKGHAYVGTLKLQGGSVRVEATEIRNAANSNRVTGGGLTIHPELTNEDRAFIDYEEIDRLGK